MSIRERSSYSIKAVENALDVLEAFSEEDGDVGVTQLSVKLGINKSVVFRLLSTFEQRGYVERAVLPGRYRAGLSAYETGRKFLQRMEILNRAKTIMEGLSRETNETIYLAVPGREDFLLLEMVEPTQQVRIIPLVGTRYPFQKFSAGKVIQAFMADQDDLSWEQQQIREQVSSIDQDALGEGIVSLAVPIFNVNAAICGSLCLVAPDFRLSQEQVKESLLARLKAAGQAVSAKLGYFDYCAGVH